jgi:hypothetical protein
MRKKAGVAQLEKFSWYLPKGTEKATEIISQESVSRGPRFEPGNFQIQILIF